MEMPIAQMKQYAQLRAQGDYTIRNRAQLLEQHKQLILEKIDRLLEDVHLLEDKMEVYKKMEEMNHG